MAKPFNGSEFRLAFSTNWLLFHDEDACRLFGFENLGAWRLRGICNLRTGQRPEQRAGPLGYQHTFKQVDPA
jgi:hypothetical protein